jgi:hypothetical protein
MGGIQGEFDLGKTSVQETQRFSHINYFVIYHHLANLSSRIPQSSPQEPDTIISDRSSPFFMGVCYHRSIFDLRMRPS